VSSIALPVSIPRSCCSTASCPATFGSHLVCGTADARLAA
jgi:hypothetical protein